MVQLVESSPGHVKGSFTISSLNQDGTRKKDKIFSVSGSINGTNISIQINGGMSELARLFGANTTFVGTISDGILKLSLGGTSSTFYKVSESKYHEILKAMDEHGKHTKILHDAVTAVAKSRSRADSINKKLKQYISWSQKRIAHTSIVKQWYAKRITYYTECLNTIKPLEMRKVPSWRWQGCVLKIKGTEVIKLHV